MVVIMYHVVALLQFGFSMESPVFQGADGFGRLGHYRLDIVTAGQQRGAI
jgi:hypothetical protein